MFNFSAELVLEKKSNNERIFKANNAFKKSFDIKWCEDFQFHHIEKIPLASSLLMPKIAEYQGSSFTEISEKNSI